MVDYLAVAAAVEGLAIIVATSKYLVKHADLELIRESQHVTAQELASNVRRVIDLEGDKLELERRLSKLRNRNFELASESGAVGRKNVELSHKVQALEAENQEWAQREADRKARLKAAGDKGRATQSAVAAQRASKAA